MIAPLRNALAFVGRHSAPAYALSIFLGLALPQLAATMRPVLPVTIFIFIVMSFARAHLDGLRAAMARPGRIGLGLLLSTLIPPLIGWTILSAAAPLGLDPGIRLAIALMAAAPPLMASPVYAALLGFENSLALILLVLGMVLAPLASPILASLLAGAEVPISPLALMQRLVIFIGGGIVTGLIVRRLLGTARIGAWKHELDGLGVVLFFLFAIAAMDGVIVATWRAPWMMIAMLAASFVIATANFAAAYVIARGFGLNDRFTLSLGIGLRNMGLLVAPIISLVPETTFLYFALAQIPIYVAPVILQRVKARLSRPAAS
jgi:BASS family bile acid:Na+ symporter